MAYYVRHRFITTLLIFVGGQKPLVKIVYLWARFHMRFIASLKLDSLQKRDLVTDCFNYSASFRFIRKLYIPVYYPSCQLLLQKGVLPNEIYSPLLLQRVYKTVRYYVEVSAQ